MTEHLSYEAHDRQRRGSGNSRNGYSPKTVTTEIGQVDLAVQRDRSGTFEPVTVPLMDSAGSGDRSENRTVAVVGCGAIEVRRSRRSSWRSRMISRSFEGPERTARRSSEAMNR